MDIGITAASLIVMRPCFEAVRSAIFRRNSFNKIYTPSPSYAQDSYDNNTSSRTEEQERERERERGIVRTVELELESRPINAERVVPKIF